MVEGGLCKLLQIDGIQSLGGTGALRIGMDLLRNVLGYDTIYVSKPTWGKLTQNGHRLLTIPNTGLITQANCINRAVT